MTHSSSCLIGLQLVQLKLNMLPSVKMTKKYMPQIYPFIDNGLNNNMDCSAMITTAGYPGKWIPIPCDTNISCSFFCVSEDTLPGNVTRPFNWFTDFSNQYDTGTAGITTRYQPNGSSVLFCPPLAVLIKNTCFLFAIADRQSSDTRPTYNATCRHNNGALLRIIFLITIVAN